MTSTTDKPRSAHNQQWHLRDPAPVALYDTLPYPPAVTTLLYQRLWDDDAGADDFAAAVAAFLTDAYPDGLHDPYLLHGMRPATARIRDALMAGEPIAIYGDFDTDGVTAVALLMHALPLLHENANVRPYIPHRHREGYGLNTAAIDDLIAAGTRLLITVDCGITNVAEVAHANAHGLDVIVTDHHRPPPDLPPALAVVNPKQPACSYPFDQLVGVGIAFKLVQALFRRQGLARDRLRASDLLDLVALGTVADMGPLVGENRVLVKAGLAALHTTHRPGIRALVAAAGVPQSSITATTIGFLLGPRLNAAGRLDDATLAYKLLLAQTLSDAEEWAAQLNQHNRDRQKLTQDVQHAAAEQGEAHEKHTNRIVLLDGDYPSGVVGLVAGRLVERWHRPVLLVGYEDDMARGSARSVVGFNIHTALSSCKDLFTRFGGHSLAAGFSLPRDRLPELEQRLLDYAATHLSDDLLQPSLWLDMALPLRALSFALYEHLQLLEPYGQGNPLPLFVAPAVAVVEVRAVGGDKQHLRLRLRDSAAEEDGQVYTAIAFGLGHLKGAVEKVQQRHKTLDIAYTLDVNEWNGERRLELRLKDFRQTAEPPAVS